MKLLAEKLHRLGIGWNERPLDDADAQALSRRLGVTLDERPLRVEGFYYRVLGRDFIAVDSRLSGPRRLAVIFHELAHCLLHAPAGGAAAGFHHIGRRTRQECEADLVALCALIPRPWLATRSTDDLISDGFPLEMLLERFRLYDVYGV